MKSKLWFLTDDVQILSVFDSRIIVEEAFNEFDVALNTGFLD